MPGTSRLPERSPLSPRGCLRPADRPPRRPRPGSSARRVGRLHFARRSRRSASRVPRRCVHRWHTITTLPLAGSKPPAAACPAAASSCAVPARDTPLPPTSSMDPPSCTSALPAAQIWPATVTLPLSDSSNTWWAWMLSPDPSTMSCPRSRMLRDMSNPPASSLAFSEESAAAEGTVDAAVSTRLPASIANEPPAKPWAADPRRYPATAAAPPAARRMVPASPPAPAPRTSRTAWASTERSPDAVSAMVPPGANFVSPWKSTADPLTSIEACAPRLTVPACAVAENSPAGSTTAVSTRTLAPSMASRPPREGVAGFASEPESRVKATAPVRICSE